jgi:glycine cleavage system regulatory protein
LARWWNQFSQLLNFHGINIDMQTEVNRAEPRMPEPSVFEVEMAIENLKTQITWAYQIPGEMLKAEGRAILSEITTY